MSGREQDFIAEAFESNYIAPLGPQVDAFEQEFAKKIGISNAVALSSCTAALHLALHVAGVRDGDEVFASTLTFIGSVSPITYLGGIPVFIDSDRLSWNMDTELLAETIHSCSKTNRLPKAVIPTDLYGQCCDLDRILEICSPFDIPVIVDAAESLGATYRGRCSGAGAKASRLFIQWKQDYYDLRWRNARIGRCRINRASTVSFSTSTGRCAPL